MDQTDKNIAMFKGVVNAALRISRTSKLVSYKRGGSPLSDDSTTDGSSSEDEAFTDLKTLSAQADLPQDFWQVKLKINLLSLNCLQALCRIYLDLNRVYESAPQITALKNNESDWTPITGFLYWFLSNENASFERKLADSFLQKVREMKKQRSIIWKWFVSFEWPENQIGSNVFVQP